MANRGVSVKAAWLRRDAQVVEMFCQGKTQSTIAKLVGISQGRVAQIVAEARAEWLARHEIAAEDHVNLSLMKLDEVYDEARLGWERSYQDAVTLTTKKSLRTPKVSKKTLEKARAKLVTTNVDEVRKGQAGDPAFLQVMKNVVDTKLKLLNAYPKDEQGPAVVINQWPWEKMQEPVPMVDAIEATPSAEVEARIEAELKSEQPPSSNGNGHV
jgi:predicted transcriptional regulator